MKPPTCGCEAVTHAGAPDTYVVLHCQRHAAVDDLLAALDGLLLHSVQQDRVSVSVRVANEAARAAIAKARGGAA